MGGIGSGNWYLRSTKVTCEACLFLDVNRLAQDDVFSPWRTGTITWTATSGKVAKAAFRTIPSGEDCPIFLITYAIGDGEKIVLPIQMQITRPHRGGHRWWFSCPLSIRDTPCLRRVGKLYLHRRYFGCRQCLGLTYRASREAHSVKRAMLFLKKHCKGRGDPS
jgi:hypothetical protein